MTSSEVDYKIPLTHFFKGGNGRNCRSFSFRERIAARHNLLSNKLVRFSLGAAFQPRRSRLKASPTNKNLLADKSAPLKKLVRVAALFSVQAALSGKRCGKSTPISAASGCAYGL
jgi:hypothetical protein